MAYIRKYRDKWRAEVCRHGHKASQVTDTKREAQAWAIRKEAELDALKGSGGKTLLTATTHYLATVSPDKSDGAADWESRRFAAMLAHFGEQTKIADIDSDSIGRWRDKRLETVSGSTVQRESNLLRHLFTLATDEWKWIKANPFKGVRLPKQNAARNQLWGWRQIKRVLRAGQRAGGKTGETAVAFHIALRTGMRMQEVLNAPANFDAVRRVVTVKTKTSTRPEEIPIGRIAAKILASTKAFEVGPNEASVLFGKLSRSQMINGLTFHDARATALTHLARKVDVMVLARISRHKDISLLHRVYYRVTSDEIARKI
jgi:integrase